MSIYNPRNYFKDGGRLDGLYSTMGSVGGSLASDIIGGGYQTNSTVSGLFDSASKIASAIPGPWGAIAGAGIGTLGGVTNALFGTKTNRQALNDARQGTNYLNNFTSNASSFDDITMADNQGAVRDAYKGGWFSSASARRKNEKLRQQREAAQARADASVYNNIGNIDADMYNGAMQNYYAKGGRVYTRPKYYGIPVFVKTRELVDNKIAQGNKAVNSAIHKYLPENVANGLDVVADISKALLLPGDGGALEAPFPATRIRRAYEVSQGLKRVSPQMAKKIANKKAAEEAAKREAEREAKAQVVNRAKSINRARSKAAAKDAAKILGGLAGLSGANLGGLYGLGYFDDSGGEGTPEEKQTIRVPARGDSYISKRNTSSETPITKSITTNNSSLQTPKIANSYNSQNATRPKKKTATSSFKRAWIKARNAGDRYFTWNGNVYNTMKSTETTESWEKWAAEQADKNTINASDPSVESLDFGDYDESAMQRVQMLTGQPDVYANGGLLSYNGADFDNGLTYIDAGGRHGDNPYGGVPMGADENGVPNLVEQGETVYNDYVFSDRMKVPKAFKDTNGLKGKGLLTYSDAAKKYAKEIEERPNDPIAQRGMSVALSRLAQSQEKERMKDQIRKQAKAAINAVDNGDIPEAEYTEEPVEGFACGGLLPIGYSSWKGNTFDDGGQVYTPRPSKIQEFRDRANKAVNDAVHEYLPEPVANGLDAIADVSKAVLLPNTDNGPMEMVGGLGSVIGKIARGGRILKNVSKAGIGYSGAGIAKGAEKAASKISNGTSKVTGKIKEGAKGFSQDFKAEMNKTKKHSVGDYYSVGRGVPRTSKPQTPATGQGAPANPSSATQTPKPKHRVRKVVGGIIGLGAAGAGGAALYKHIRNKADEQNYEDEMYNDVLKNINEYADGGQIHIAKNKRGTFTASATKHGMGVQEFASHVLSNPDDYSPAMRKKANFARNAAHWHAYGGPLGNYFAGKGKRPNTINVPQLVYQGFAPLPPLQDNSYKVQGSIPTNEDWYLEPYRNILHLQETAHASSPSSLTRLRYVPAFGAAVSSITDALGLTNRPDYAPARAIESAARRYGDYTPVTFNPIGNYTGYTPLDRLFYSNRLENQSAGNARNIMNTGATRGAAVAGLLANDYNANNRLGELYRAGDEYNAKQRLAADTFNRETDKYNSEGDLRAQMANQEARQRQQSFGFTGLLEAQKLRQNALDRASTARSANLTNLFNSLGEIGREAYMRNTILTSPWTKWYVDNNGKMKYKVEQ